MAADCPSIGMAFGDVHSAYNAVGTPHDTPHEVSRGVMTRLMTSHGASWGTGLMRRLMTPYTSHEACLVMCHQAPYDVLPRPRSLAPHVSCAPQRSITPHLRLFTMHAPWGPMTRDDALQSRMGRFITSYKTLMIGRLMKASQ